MEFEKLIQIYNRLQDDESRQLFNLMIKKAMSSDYMGFIPGLASWCHNPKVDERFIKKVKDCDGIILYGCGEFGRISKVALEACGYNIECFCDTYKTGISVDGADVLNVRDAAKIYPNHLFCVCSVKYGMEMYQNLWIADVQDKRIYIPRTGFIIGSSTENQYVDVLEPPTSGVIVDAGAYDGKTALRFIKWVGKGNYSKIVCYEPEATQAEIIKDVIVKEKMENVEVINAGLWDRDDELHFRSDNEGSHFTPNGETIVKCTSIDGSIKGKVGFIKMDIEGAELKALQGAKNTILRDRPKMAICIYHKKSDIYDIGSFLMDIWPDCKMKIRHYTTCHCETVLYVE